MIYFDDENIDVNHYKRSRKIGDQVLQEQLRLRVIDGMIKEAVDYVILQEANEDPISNALIHLAVVEHVDDANCLINTAQSILANCLKNYSVSKASALTKHYLVFTVGLTTIV